MLDICLLGTGGMMPMPGRFLTAMLARLEGRLMLIDCGEGTQVTMKQLGWGFKAIDVICFTHYHADHISGLPGLLLTIGNAGRTEPLTLIGPIGLEYVVEGMRRIAPELPYEICYIEIDENTPSVINVGDFNIKWQSVEHIIRCFAYKLEVKRLGRFDVTRAEALCIPKNIWGRLQNDGQAEFEGKIYTRDMVMGDERPGISVAYCTDSSPVDRLIPFIKDATLFICEGMYGENEKRQKAIENKHMLFSEAARLALAGKVGTLWLTHFSPALSAPEEFLHVAKKIFQNTELGEERKKITLLFPQ